MIGNVEMCFGLYLLKGDNSLRRQAQNASCVSLKSQSSLIPCVNKDKEVVLCHYCLGHPNFMYLEKLLPSLFKNNTPTDSTKRLGTVKNSAPIDRGRYQTCWTPHLPITHLT